MPAIAEIYATVLPETSKIADGIVRAFREVDPKAREAGRRWGREIQQGMDDVKVELKADTAKAKAQIDEAAKDKKATVEVDADTAKAEAQIDAVARDRKATIEVNADTLMSSVQRAGSQLGPSLASAGASAAPQVGGSLSSVMGPVGTALSGALIAGAVTAAAGVAAALSGVVGLIPAGLAGAGSVIGTLATGLDGVKDAWDAAGKAADSASKDQEEKTKAVASAQKSLRDAVQDEANAQKDVANARRDARQQLEDLNIQLRGGVIDERQAILDAQAARRDLATGRFKDSIEYQQAQLRVEQADQRVLEAHERNVQLQDKATESNAKGVEQSDQVVAANERLQRAHENVATAQQNLAEAQTKTSSAADAASAAMAKLSPNAQAFVGTLLQMKPLWESFKNSVQDALFANLGPQIQQLATNYMPILQGAFTQLAGLINQGASALMQFLELPETRATIQGLLSNLNESFRQFLPVMGTFGQAFLQMTSVGAAFLPQLGQIIGQFATAFSGFVNSGGFAKWLETGLIALQQLTNMLPTLLQMFNDLAPIGTATLGALGQVLTALQPAIAPLANMFASFINAMAPWWGLLTQLAATIVGSLAPAFTQLFNAVAPLVQQIATAFQPVMATLGPVLMQTAQIFLGAMIPAVQQLIPLMVPMVQQMAQLALTMMPLLPSFMQMATAAVPILTQSLQVILPFVTRFMELATRGASIVMPQLSAAMTTAADLFTKGWNTIKTAVETTWNVIKPIFDAIKNAIHNLGIDKLLGAVSRFLPNLPGAASPLSGVPGTPGGTTSSGFNWDAVMPHEGRTWNNADTGHNGHFGGLQFSPGTWKDYGGEEFAPRADLASPEQQKTVADRVAFYGYNGRPPQGLGAWEAITKGKVPGITASSVPPGLPTMATPSLVAPGQGVGSYWARNPGAPTQAGTWGAIPVAPTTTVPSVTSLPGTPYGLPAGTNSGGYGGSGAQFPDWVNQIAAAFGIKPSTYPGHQESDRNEPGYAPNPGHQNRAIDWSGPTENLQRFAEYLLSVQQGMEQVIWQNPQTGQQIGIAGGKVAPAGYYAGDFGGHTDHVHTRQSMPIPLPGGGLSSPGYYPSAMMPTMASPYGISPDGRMPLGTQGSPMYVMPAQNDSAKQLGQDFLSGILEIFGLDGLIANPLGTPVFQGFKGLMSMLTGGGKGGGGLPASAYQAMGGDGAQLPMLGGGGDLFSGLASSVLGNVPSPYTPGIGVPDEFAPVAAGGQPAGPGIPGKTAGPGPNQIDQRIIFNGPVGNPQAANQAAMDLNVPRARQAVKGF